MGSFIFDRKIYIVVVTSHSHMSFADKIYNLLNNFSTEHFQDSAEATISAGDFDILMRNIGEALSSEKG